jgi:dTDP-glucose 4,6-dehydratase
VKCLILGSNSFAGANLVSYLLDKGSEVIGVSRSPEPNNIFLPYKYSNNQAAFSFHQVDINKEGERLFNLIEQERPEFVVDFAGQGMVAQSWDNPEQWFQTNVASKARLHNFLKHLDFLEKYIRISSPEVYGNCPDPVDVTASYSPSTPYAVSHVAIDLSLGTFFQQYQFPVIFARFVNFFGPGQQLYRIVPRTIIYALTGQTLYLDGGGATVRSFLHCRDVAEGVFRLIEGGVPGEVYHFANTESISIRQLVEKICFHVQIDMNDFVREAKERPGKDQAYLLKWEKSLKELGWSPQIDLDTGIDETIDWVQKNFDEIRTLPRDYIHQK